MPLNTRASVLFSGPIDPTSMTGAQAQISGGGQTVPASISFGPNSQTAEITPEGTLPASTAMTLTVSGVTDAAGNTVPTHTSHFTTGTAPVLSSLYAIAENPTYQTTGAPLNAEISIEANGAIDATTVNSGTFYPRDNLSYTEVTGSYALSADATTATFTPSMPLAADRQYGVLFQNRGMTDLAGDTLTCCVNGTLGDFYFSTGFASSTTGPQVMGVNPPNGLQQVPTNPQIVVQFSGPVDAESLGGVKLSAGTVVIPATTRLSNNNQTLTLTPGAELAQNTAYKLTVAGVTDFSGRPMPSAFTSGFTTGADPDFSQLSVTGYDPANTLTGVPQNTLVRLQFNKAVDAQSVSSASVVLYLRGVSGASNVTGKVVLSGGGTLLTMTPSSALLAETQYCVYVNGIVDEEGNGLAQNNQTLSCFTTGASMQTTAPVIAGVSPPSGAAGVFTNAVIEAQLSVPLGTTSVGQNAITVTAGGVTAAGVVTANAGSNTVTFTPSALLAANTAYSVSVGGFTDLAGNTVTRFTSGFTTGTGAATALQVVSITPASSSSEVSVTSPVVVTFSGGVNPLTVTADSVIVQANTLQVAGSYAVNGATVTFTPSSPLPGGATVEVYVDYPNRAPVTDLAGNPGNYVTSTFTTAATADTVLPKVVSVTPGNGATGIGTNGQVAVLFSKSMNPGTLMARCSGNYFCNVLLLAGGTRLGFTAMLSADNRMLTMSSLDLPESTVITVVVTHGATDLSGNAVVDFESQFTTGPGVETGHGGVVSQRPGNTATGVSVNASPIVMFLNVALDPATVQGAVHVAVNGQLVTGTVAVAGNGQTIEFTPTAPWAYGALVQVFLDATAMDVSGNTVTAYQASFTTQTDPAVTAPVSINYSPGYNTTGVPLNAVIHAVFSEPLSAAAVNATNVYLNGPSGRVASTLGLDSTGSIVGLTPEAALTANSQYCFYVRSQVGVNGLAVQQNVGYCFITGAAAVTTAPAVTATSPADGLTGVPLNAVVRVLFAAPIDPLTATAATMALSGGATVVLPSSFSFSPNNELVQITPESPLPASTAMTLTIKGVTDVAGNAITQTTHFTTGTAPALNPVYLVAANPVNATPPALAAVPVNTLLSLTATAQLDPTTVNASSFLVNDTSTNTMVTGTYSESSNGTVVSLVPGAPLTANHGFSVYFQNRGITDLAGNSLTANGPYLHNFSFTTGAGSGSLAPQVSTITPAQKATQVPTNTAIVVQFNEPVDAQSLGKITLSANGRTVGVGSGLYGGSCAGNGAGFGTACAVLSTGNTLLTITPAVTLAPDTSYTVTVAGVTDLAGNAMTASFVGDFRTGADPDFSELFPMEGGFDGDRGGQASGGQAGEGQARVTWSRLVWVAMPSL